MVRRNKVLFVHCTNAIFNPYIFRWIAMNSRLIMGLKIGKVNVNLKVNLRGLLPTAWREYRTWISWHNSWWISTRISRRKWTWICVRKWTQVLWWIQHVIHTWIHATIRREIHRDILCENECECMRENEREYEWENERVFTLEFKSDIRSDNYKLKAKNGQAHITYVNRAVAGLPAWPKTPQAR